MLKAVRRITLFAMATVLVACGSGSPNVRPSDSPLVMGTNAASRLEVEVEGSESFTFSGMVELRILIGGLDPNIPESLGFLSVGLLAPVTLQDGRLMRTAFDLLGYQEAGAYEFGPGAKLPSGFKPPAGLDSNTFVELTDLPSPLVTFNKLGARCSLRLAEGARSGALSCPELADEAGNVISLRVEWTPS